MKALSASRYWHLSSLFRGAFPISRSRTPLTSLDKCFLCEGNLAYSSGNGSVNSIVVPPALSEADKDEAKSVLTLFLKKQGLSKTVAASTTNKSDLFIDHLLSRLHKSRIAGRELTTLEIRDTLFPYLDSLIEEHGNILRDLVENFPDTAAKEKPAASASQSHSTLYLKKPKAVSPFSDTDRAGELRPQVLHYLIELEVDLEQIKVITRRFPKFASCSLQRGIKPLFEFLHDIGISKSPIPKIISKMPQLCGLSLSRNVIPSMIFLEDLGVDKKQWTKVINNFPQLLTLNRQ